jgi:nitrate reductase NapAB chaperone NapD
MINKIITESTRTFLNKICSGLGKIIVLEISKENLKKILNDIKYLEKNDEILLVECFFSNIDSESWESISDYIELSKVEELKSLCSKDTFSSLIIIHCENKCVLDLFLKDDTLNLEYKRDINKFSYNIFVGETINSGIQLTAGKIDEKRQEIMNKFSSIEECFVNIKSKKGEFEVNGDNHNLLEQIKVDINSLRRLGHSFFYFVGNKNSPNEIIFSFEDVIKHRSKVTGPRILISNIYFSKTESDIFFEDYIKPKFSNERYYTTFETTKSIHLYLPFNP